MKSNQRARMEGGRQSFLLRLPGLLLHSIWTPERDERLFLVGLPVAMFLIPLLWKHGIHRLEGYWFPATFGFWCLAYVIKFRRRLMERGELKFVIAAPAIFVVFLLCLSLY